jgi:hypothetical protein
MQGDLAAILDAAMAIEFAKSQLAGRKELAKHSRQ